MTDNEKVSWVELLAGGLILANEVAHNELISPEDWEHKSDILGDILERILEKNQKNLGIGK